MMVVILQSLVPLLGALVALVAAVAPALARWDRLGRLRRLNRAVEETPAGKGHDALVEARDAFATRLSVSQLWMRPALLTMLRNVGAAIGVVVAVGVSLEIVNDASWAPRWLDEIVSGGVARGYRITGVICSLAAAGIQGWISAGRRGWIDSEIRKRLDIPTPDGFWSRLFQ